jgi:hypothetical protein
LGRFGFGLFNLLTGTLFKGFTMEFTKTELRIIMGYLDRAADNYINDAAELLGNSEARACVMKSAAARRELARRIDRAIHLANENETFHVIAGSMK